MQILGNNEEKSNSIKFFNFDKNKYKNNQVFLFGISLFIFISISEFFFVSMSGNLTFFYGFVSIFCHSNYYRKLFGVIISH